MDPLTGSLIGAGGGLLKSLFDGGKADRERKLQAETTRWSPWTGMTAQAPSTPDAFGSIMQGGLSGFALGQNAQGAANQDALNNRYAGILEKMAGTGTKVYDVPAGPNPVYSAPIGPAPFSVFSSMTNKGGQPSPFFMGGR